MGTRGAFGFRSEGVDKVTYNHYDSYPTGLGKDIMLELNRVKMGVNDWRKMFDKVEMVKTARDDKNYGKKTVDMKPSYLNNSLSMVDSSKFLHDSLFCEWAYILNLDDEVLEIYQGSNKCSKSLGRYAGFQTLANKEDADSYHGVKLIAVIHLDDLYSTTAKQIYEVCEMLERVEIKTSTIQSMTALSEEIEKILADTTCNA